MKRWWSALIALVVIAAWMLWQAEDAQPLDRQAPEKVLQLGAENIERQRFDASGNLEQTLSAERLQQYTDGSTTLYGVVLHGPNWTLTANQADTTDQVTFVLQGQVRLEQSNGLLLRTEKLIHQNDTQSGRAPGVATIERSSARTQGRDMYYDLTNERVEFNQHETSTFLPRPDR